VSSLTVLEGPAYFNFINSLKAKETKMQYRRGIERFMTYAKIPSLSGLLSLPSKDIEQLVIHYITYLKARGLSHAYVNLAMAAIFPTKTYLKTSILGVCNYTILKGLESKIISPDKKEITIDELVDHYYGDAEDYFSLSNNTTEQQQSSKTDT
jgi:hypothetical protein